RIRRTQVTVRHSDPGAPLGAPKGSRIRMSTHRSTPQASHRPSPSRRPSRVGSPLGSPVSSPPRLSRPDVIARLRAAGCVFAEDEAELLLATAHTPAALAAMVD